MDFYKQIWQKSKRMSKRLLQNENWSGKDERERRSYHRTGTEWCYWRPPARRRPDGGSEEQKTGTSWWRTPPGDEGACWPQPWKDSSDRETLNNDKALCDKGRKEHNAWLPGTKLHRLIILESFSYSKHSFYIYLTISFQIKPVLISGHWLFFFWRNNRL